MKRPSVAVDEAWMQKALALAKRAMMLETRPNPRVGCIIIKNGRVIASAFHPAAGKPHAEALALQKAGPKAIGATAYVTLEPCCHTDKKTPPCAQAIIQAGIRRVVIACTDENPKVSGRGIRLLQRAGIQVTQGILKKYARKLNRFFFHWTRTGRPFTTLKMAATLDGKITSSQKWLSNAKALRFVQQLRVGHDAILVGKNTVLKDDPRLTVRTRGKNAPKQPMRIILDSRLDLSKVLAHMRVAKNGPLLAICTPAAPEKAKQTLQLAGIGVWTAPKADGDGSVPLRALLAELGRRGIRSLLVEGGGKTATAFLEQDLVDEAWFVTAPILAGPEGTPLYSGREIRLKNASVAPMGDDAVFHVAFRKPKT